MNSYYEAVPVEQELPEADGVYHTIDWDGDVAANYYAGGNWFNSTEFMNVVRPAAWLRPVSSLPEDAVKKALPNKSSKDAEGEEDDICDECGNDDLSECKCERYFCDICNGTSGTHKKGCPNDDSPFAEMQRNGHD